MKLFREFISFSLKVNLQYPFKEVNLQYAVDGGLRKNNTLYPSIPLRGNELIHPFAS
jgi:hypothetical protein